MTAPGNDPPSTAPDIPSPSRTRQRIPSLFAPSEHQQTRLLALLNNPAAVDQVLAAALAHGLPIGSPKPSAHARQLAPQARSLQRALRTLDDQIRAHTPAWQALREHAASTADSAPLARLLDALDSPALAALIEHAGHLTNTSPGQRGRPADTGREARMQLMRTLATIAEDSGLHVGRLAANFYELVEIVFDLTYITGVTPDTAVRDLLDERATLARRGRRQIRNLL